MASTNKKRVKLHKNDSPSQKTTNETKKKERGRPAQSVRINMVEKQRRLEEEKINASAQLQTTNLFSTVPNSSIPCTKFGASGLSVAPSPSSVPTESDIEVTVGPNDPSLLYSFENHIASKIWTGEKDDRVLKVISPVAVVDLWDLDIECAYVREKVTKSGFISLIKYSHRKLDKVLVSAFVERFYPETNTFHLPFGEMMITLDDVAHILDLPIDGYAVEDERARNIKYTEIYTLLGETLGMSQNDSFAELKNGKVKTISLPFLRDKYHKVCQEEDPKEKKDMTVRAFLLYVIGSCLCADKTGNRVSVLYLLCLIDVDKINNYSWGTACLAHLLHELGNASRWGSQQITGCMSLLQSWIYLHMPTIRRGVRLHGFCHGMPLLCRSEPGMRKLNDSKLSLRKLREEIDDLIDTSVVWDPYKTLGAQYSLGPWAYYSGLVVCFDVTVAIYPHRVLRQFGFCQDVPSKPLKPYLKRSNMTHKNFSPCYENMGVWTWNNWHSHLMADEVKVKANTLSECTPRYMTWYKTVSHLNVTNPTKRITVSGQPTSAMEEGITSSAHSFIQRLRIGIGKMLVNLKTGGGGLDEPLSPNSRKQFYDCLEELYLFSGRTQESSVRGKKVLEEESSEEDDGSED